MTSGFKWDLGLVMNSAYDSGALGVQVDGYGEQDAGVAHGDPHLPYGFMSRPLDPELDSSGQPNPQRACSVMYAWEGGRIHTIPVGDPRVLAKIPQLKKGGSLQYAATGAFFELDGETGSETLYIPYAFNGDVPTKAMVIAVNVRTAGAESIEFVHGDGMSVTMAAGGKNSVVVKNKAGDAYVEINDDGVTLNGNTKLNGGVDIGGTGALPLTLAVPLASYLTALETVLTTLATALDAKLAPTPGVNAGVVTAFIAAGTTFKTAMTALLAKGK